MIWCGCSHYLDVTAIILQCEHSTVIKKSDMGLIWPNSCIWATFASYVNIALVLDKKIKD